LGTDNALVLVAAAVDRWGRLDVMVANAGIGAYGGIMDASDDELAEMVSVNILGTVWAVRAAVPSLRAGGGGDVVIISSVAGLRSDANEAVYGATKFAQLGLADGIDKELRPEGIRVMAFCPAGIKTEFALGRGRTEGDPALDDYLRPEDIAAEIVAALSQPRRLRTSRWVTWPMSQG